MDYIELEITVSPVDPGTEILAALLSGMGFIGFEETGTGLRTYLPEIELKEDILSQIPGLLGKEFNVRYLTRRVPDKDWNELWEKSYEPVFIANRVYIRAPFHPSRQDAEIELLIVPKMSFGTGHHETTSLVVEFLLEEDVTDKKILDAGCGTGVLSLVAEKLGASHIDAFDFDEWAYKNTTENIRHNNSTCICVYQGMADMIPDEDYDMILANINLNVILDDLGKYANHLDEKGILVLSGFYDSDVESITKKAFALGLRISGSKKRNNWTALRLIKS